ncbi:MAG: hypothetical protein JXR51_06450 [Bacteroidales bacterium]|nr:hypothetical protein [Bacteroidales bacterium]MBN2756802.1 hypothetical protein [Bacteroidales bacterium]
MLKNRTTIFITIGILILIAIGMQFIGKKEKTINQTIKAIPEDAAIILESNNLYELIDKFNSKNLIKKEFSDISVMNGLFDNLDFLDSVLTNEIQLKNIFSNNNVIISSHFSGKKSNEFLFVVPIKKKTDADAIKNFISKKVSKSAIIKQRDYENINIFDVNFYEEIDQENNFYYYFENNSFVFSFSKILLEKSARKINKKNSILSNSAFRKLSATAGKNVDANIYINYNFFPKILSNFVNQDYNSAIDFLDYFAYWSAFDLKLKDDAIILSGYTYAKDSINQYLSTFNKQKSLDNDFLEVLPNNTAAFVALNLSNINEWKNQYISYLKRYDKFKKYIKPQTKYENDINDLFYKNIEGSACIAWINKSLSQGENDIVGVFQLADNEKFTEEMNNLSPIDSLDKKVLNKLISIDSENNINAKQFFLPKIFSVLFGNIFNNLNASYYFITDDYVVFANSVSVLSNFYQKLKIKNSLKNDTDFQNFSKSISSESNIFVYSNFSYSKLLINNILNSEYQKNYIKNIEKFNKLQAISLQFSSSKELFFSSIYLNYKPVYKRDSKNIWEIKLDTLIIEKPQIVKNHNTGNNDVILQDANNKLYLISEEGKILWKKKLSEKILGKIHQIDFYKNNKLQYMFNTKSTFYLIDRNGNNVENYPINFKSPATNGISIFDYDKNKDYRILVACENKNIYLLNKNGGKIDGWEFGETQSLVHNEAQHFIHDKKDYIIFSDINKTYIVDRRGKIRIKPQLNFERSKNNKFYFEKGKSKEDARFVCTNNKGVIYFIFLDGSVKKLNLDEFSENHNFSYVDLLGNNANYFVFTDNNKLIVYNRDKSVRFENKFNSSIDNSLSFYQFNKGIKYIGLTEKNKNKIYLFNPNGKLITGFPMDGCSPFNITSINTKSKNLNLIVGSNNNKLNNYSFINEK